MSVIANDRNTASVGFVHSLKARLLLICVLLALVPGAIIAYIGIRNATSSLRQEMDQRLESVVTVQASRVAEWATSGSKEVQALANTAEMRTMDPELAGPALVSAQSKMNGFQTLMLVSPEGDFLASSDGSTGNVSERAYFAPTMAGQTVISEPVVSKATGDVAVVCTAPIKGADGSVGGILIGTLSLKALYENELSDVDLGSGYVFILDKTGVIIAHPVADKLLVENLTRNSSAALAAVATDMTKGGTEVSAYTYEGVEKVVAYAPVGVNGWSIAAAQPSAEALAGVQSFTRTTLILLVLVALVSATVSIFVAGSIANPISLMTEVAADLAEGGLGDGLDQSNMRSLQGRRDEIGLLGQAFSVMTAASADMAQAADRVADYDLTAEVQPRGERDVLGKALHTMIANLRSAIASVRQGADAVTQSSATLAGSADSAGQATSQVAMTIEEVARGSAQTAQSINAASRSTEELNHAIDGIAKGSQESAGAVGVMSSAAAAVADAARDIEHRASLASSEADGGRSVAREGLQAMQATLTGMDAIRSTVQEAASEVEKMGKRSAEIGQIVGTIEDIASQTNLLALNAQIEAARAGEQGRGFAVVADEVRKLAERSARATKEIAQLITAVQEGSSGAVAAMSQGAKEVANGAQLAQQSGAVIERLQSSVEAIVGEIRGITDLATALSGASSRMMGEVERVSAVVEESSAATEEMSASSTAVSESLGSVAAVAEEASASAEEVAASAEELAAQIQEVHAISQEMAQQAKAMRQSVELFQLAASEHYQQPTQAQPFAPRPVTRQESAPRLATVAAHGNGNGNGHRR
ncbi:MAG: methyl-accepting chemotaxis protein [Anaerolineae bacterium]